MYVCCVYMCACTRAYAWVSQHVCDGQRTTFEGQFSSAIIWDMGMVQLGGKDLHPLRQVGSLGATVKWNEIKNEWNSIAWWEFFSRPPSESSVCQSYCRSDPRVQRLPKQMFYWEKLLGYPHGNNCFILLTICVSSESKEPRLEERTCVSSLWGKRTPL